MNAHPPAISLSDAYDLAAQWHDKNARHCAEVYEDAPRIEEKIRERAGMAAAHHRASAAGLRIAAADMRRRAIKLATT